MSKINSVWNKIPDEKKKPVAIVLALAALCIVILLAYKTKTATETPKPVRKNNTVEIGYDKKKMEQGIIAKADAKSKMLEEKFDTLVKIVEKQAENQNNTRAALESLAKNLGQKIDQVADKSDKKTQNGPKIPAPPNGTNQRRTTNPSYPPAPNMPMPQPKVEIEYIGGIRQDRGEIKSEPKEEEKKNEIYLPPSFMPATLLAGITAPTMTKDKEDPMPILVRVNDLAVLPNEVKANLKGCFIFGEAEGKLRDERAHARTTLLSCIDKNGSGVIEEEIRGYLTDGEDGKVGMAGHAVAKMDLAVSRAVWAGLVGGLGEGFKMSTSQTEFSDSGNVNQILTENDATTILKYGLGQGISDGAKELQKFYLQLAEESGPVIEVGATKQVNVVITKGVTLRIKEENLM